MKASEFAEALGGEVKGTVTEERDRWRWQCLDCDATGSGATELDAGFGLYRHRQKDCGSVV